MFIYITFKLVNPETCMCGVSEAGLQHEKITNICFYIYYHNIVKTFVCLPAATLWTINTTKLWWIPSHVGVMTANTHTHKYMYIHTHRGTNMGTDWPAFGTTYKSKQEPTHDTAMRLTHTHSHTHWIHSLCPSQQTAFITFECVSAATDRTSVCVKTFFFFLIFPYSGSSLSCSWTHTACTHTPLASSFLFNECQTAHPKEKPHGRNLLKQGEKKKKRKREEAKNKMKSFFRNCPNLSEVITSCSCPCKGTLLIRNWLNGGRRPTKWLTMAK